MLFTAQSRVQAAPANVICVNASAGGTDNGSSWANAHTDLQSALAAAGSGSEIWVSAGTYKPTDSTDRSISFELKSGVALYGGFAGTESALGDRDVTRPQAEALPSLAAPSCFRGRGDL